MKVARYILNHLKEEGVKHAFVYQGGAIAPTINEFDKDENLDFICPAHEQAGAIAAEAYSRVSRNLGVAITTSGPGATNLITGIACAFFDSIPTLFITGQVNPNESTWEGGPRQVGFQETNIVKIVEPITKYAVRVNDPKTIKFELEKAIYLAREGRPGPVLLDLPFNTQIADLEISELESYSPLKKEFDDFKFDEKFDQVKKLLENSERPVIVLGAGVKLAKAEDKIINFVEELGIPIVSSWGALDVVPYDHPLFIEGFGVSHGRAGNFAIQNSDLLISLGSRLDTRQTGGKRATFARGAKKIVVDIDSSELSERKNLEIDVPINCDLNYFLEKMSKRIGNFQMKDISNWKEKTKFWKEKYPPCLPEYFNQQEKVNPYVFMNALSEESKEKDIIAVDTGATLMWAMQNWKTKKYQKLFSDFGHSSMGYALPASIGASFASEKCPVICITGDGGIKMNIQELETIVRHNLPIHIFVINNHELATIKQFQDGLFNSKYNGSSVEGGLGDADLLAVAQAYGLKTVQINNHQEMREKIRGVLDSEEPVLCSVELKQGEWVVPKAGFGRPIEDPQPFLSDEEFEENMIVPSLRVNN